MRHKFLQDLGIDIEEDTKDVLRQFDLNGFLDEISDNRLKEEEEKVEELKEEIENSESDADSEDNHQ